MCEPLSPFQRDDPCDLCRGTDFRLLAQQDRQGKDLTSVICRVCGLATHADRPSESELADYYRSHYRREYHGEYTPSPHRVVRAWNRGRELRKLLQPLLHRTDRILEIGSGIGCTVSQFRRTGYQASGIEPGEGFRRFAQSQLNVPVSGTVLADLPHKPMADVILLVHVLEHLRSPSEALHHIRSLLYPGGRCYVEVPNAGAPHAAPGKIFHFAHVYNLTQDTLSMLADKANFRVAKWLSSPRDKDLRVMLECAEPADWRLVAGSYQRAVAAMHGGSRLGYYLRWDYVRQRFGTCCRHASDRILAARRVARIVDSSRHSHAAHVGLLPAAPRVAYRKG